MPLLVNRSVAEQPDDPPLAQLRCLRPRAQPRRATPVRIDRCPPTPNPLRTRRPPIRESLRIAGEKVSHDRVIEVRHPYSGALVGTVPKATLEDVQTRAQDRARLPLQTHPPRALRDPHEGGRHHCREARGARAADHARIGPVSEGLALRGRPRLGCLLFAANQALVDDGQVFSCDLTAHGKSRKVYTLQEPLLGVITAITPFNHPLNQVIHKVAPAIATNNRVVLKPSEKTPLTASRSRTSCMRRVCRRRCCR